MNSSPDYSNHSRSELVAAECVFSLVIPAYNEALRLPRFLDQVRNHLNREFGERYEVIVVDDGSTDGQSALCHDLAANWPQMRILTHSINQGKGAAVRTGMLDCVGQYCLFADADGATPIGEEVKLRRALDDGADYAVGSRFVSDGQLKRRRTWKRRALGFVFATITRWSIRLKVRDTQCGFKMFRRRVAHCVFENVHESGYIFDIHVLAVAELLGFHVAEVGVEWSEIPGSKLSLIRDSARMLWDLILLRQRLPSVKEARSMMESCQQRDRPVTRDAP